MATWRCDNQKRVVAVHRRSSRTHSLVVKNHLVEQLCDETLDDLQIEETTMVTFAAVDAVLSTCG